jgi:hypothetical protein
MTNTFCRRGRLLLRRYFDNPRGEEHDRALDALAMHLGQCNDGCRAHLDERRDWVEAAEYPAAIDDSASYDTDSGITEDTES